MKAPIKRKLRTRILLALGALLISYIVYGLFQENFNTWDSRIIDQLFVLRPKVNPVLKGHPDLVIHVDANLYSSRPQHAQVIRNLTSMQVSAQLIDFIFTDMVSTTDDQPLLDATRKAGNVYFGLAFEQLMRQAVKVKENSADTGDQLADVKKWQPVIDTSPDYFWVGAKPNLPYQTLASASRGLGFLNLTPDPDGIIRRLLLLVRYRGAIYPSLSLRLLCDYLSVSPQQVVVTPGNSVTLKDAQPVDGSGLQDIVIPIDKSGNMILNIAQSWYDIPHYSYSEIFQASENSAALAKLKKELAGKIAIISETVETRYQTRATGPQKLLSSGVIQALVLQNILAGSFLRELPQYAAVLIEIGLLLLIIYLSLRFSSPALSLSTIVLTGAYICIAAVLFFYGGVIFQFVRPLLIILCALAFLLIGLGIENALLFAQTERARKMAERELEIGRQIQAGFFPTSLPAPQGWELATHFQAARHVAGDFYDVFTLGEEKKVGLVIADVCDKGVGAALFMALFRSFIRVLSGTAHSEGHLAIGNPTTDPVKILQKTILSINNYISITHEEAGMFATIFYGILDPAKGILTYINGGHEPPVIIGAAGIKASLDPTGPAVGLYPDLVFKIRTVKLEPEDVLLVYTDGVIDARNKAGEAFGKRKLQDQLVDSSLSAEELIKEINARINDHIQNENQFDDITIMALRRMA
ncbi:Serine phosphatase RsbU, regulator of sigma subunit [Olavius sp. associated proteobacterium Delta 1]|nr:Serine phosphatase RsbU, regulator of sigma subunit [Olavius sp. associated proteobacterium Delta 1]